MAEQDGTKPKRRRRKASEVSSEVAALLAKRDTLDADKAERERIEKDAFQKFAEAKVQIASIDGEASHKIEDLRRQIAEVEQKAKDDRAAAEQAQAEALATLNVEPVGRKADELAQLFEMPIKRVRRLIQDGKRARAPKNSAATVNPAVPTEWPPKSPIPAEKSSGNEPPSVEAESGTGANAAAAAQEQAARST